MNPLLPCLPDGEARKHLCPPVAFKPLKRRASQGIETSMGMLAKDASGLW